MPNKEYDELRERPQGLVDAIAYDRLEGHSMTGEEIVELAAELTETEVYDPTSIDYYRDNYPGVIEKRTQILANEREEHDGEIVTVGETGASYTGPAEGIDATYQHISERPQTATAGADDDSLKHDETDGDDSPERVTTEGGLEATLTGDEAFGVIRTADLSTARSVFEKLTDTELSGSPIGGRTDGGVRHTRASRRE